MGQKAHPYGLRLGYIKPWKGRWFARHHFSEYLHEDLKIRAFLKKKLAFAGITNIEIERSSGRVRVRIYTARPGVIIGRRGQEIDKIKEGLAHLTQNELFVDIKEVKNPHTDAQLVAENIALQLEKRVSFRKAMKKAIQMAMTKGGLGIKVKTKGRLGGAEIAREEGYREGKIPLNTLRADVDYGFAEAFTTYGTIGVKVWIYKGDILVKKEEAERKQAMAAREMAFDPQHPQAPPAPAKPEKRAKKKAAKSASIQPQAAELGTQTLEPPAETEGKKETKETEGNTESSEI